MMQFAGINLYCEPTPLMLRENFYDDESMIIAKLLSDFVADDTGEIEVGRITIPKSSLTNIGDMLLVDFIGDFGDTTEINMRAATSIDDLMALNGETNQVMGYADGGPRTIAFYRLTMILVGTNTVKYAIQLITNKAMGGENNVGGSNLWGQVGSQGIDVAQDFDIFFTIENTDGARTPQFTRKSIVARLIKNTGGLANFGTPTDVTYSPSGLDNVTWNFDVSNYPNPGVWIVQREVNTGGVITWDEALTLPPSTNGFNSRSSVSTFAMPAGFTGRVRIVGKTDGIAITNFSNIVAISPLLSITTDTQENLSWTWNPTIPDHWVIEFSADGINWQPQGTVAGNVNSAAFPLASGQWRVWGADSGGAPVTGISMPQTT